MATLMPCMRGRRWRHQRRAHTAADPVRDTQKHRSQSAADCGCVWLRDQLAAVFKGTTGSRPRADRRPFWSP